MQVSIEDAYKEACLALGEAIVRERLLSNEIDRLNAPVQMALEGLSDVNGKNVKSGGLQQNGKVSESSAKS